jgi:tetratricopeptide (TPR) repeat protein
VFDDIPRIVENFAIQTLWPPSIAMAETNRPFGMFTFAINYAIHQHELWGYHATNLAIHVLAALSLFSIVRRTLTVLPRKSNFTAALADRSVSLGFAVAAIWACHPLQTQSVTYIVQRLESLMGLAYLATLLFFVMATQSKRPVYWYFASLAVCAFGMGCKEVMVTAPVIVLWYDRVFVATSWRQLLAHRWLYFLGLASTWSVLAWAMLRYQVDYTGGALVTVEGLTWWSYLWNQTAVIWKYLQLCFLPVDQCLYRKWPLQEAWSLLPSAVSLLSLAIATVVGIFRFPKLAFLSGFFFLTLAPTSSVVPIRDLYFEHRMYLPLAAVVCLSVFFAYWLSFQFIKYPLVCRWAFNLFVFASVIGLSALTYQRNQDYQSAITLWTSTVNVSPDNATAWSNLGLAYIEGAQHSEAARCFKKSIELKPDDVDALASYAGALIETGDLKGAEQVLQRALQLQPNNELAILNQGNLLFRSERYGEAIDYFLSIINFKPDNLECRISLSACYLYTQRYRQAEEHCKLALQQDPQSVSALINLSCAQGGQGQIEQAIVNCRQALQLDPNSPNAHGTLAMLYAESDPQEAKKHLSIASQLETASPVYDIALGNMLVETDSPAAIVCFQDALKKDPQNVEARLGLIGIYEKSGPRDALIAELEILVKQIPDLVELKYRLEALRSN